MRRRRRKRTALIDPEKTEEIERTVTDRDREAYPGMTGKYGFRLRGRADGVRL